MKLHRVAAPAPFRRHLSRTLLWMVLVWFLALVALPVVLRGIERVLGIERVDLAGGPVAGGLLWHVVIRPSEERFLTERFGDDYRAYRASVPLWIPRRPAR